MASAFQNVSIAKVVEEVDATSDPRSALQRVREMRQAAEARGEAVPEAVIKLEKQLTQECIAESQGR